MEFTMDMFDTNNVEAKIATAKLRLNQEDISLCPHSCSVCPLNYKILCTDIFREARVDHDNYDNYTEARDTLLDEAFTKFLEFYDKPKIHHINFMEE